MTDPTPEDLGITAREAYEIVAEELSDPDTDLTDLAPDVVAVARTHAKRSHKAWPPHPIVTGWVVHHLGTDR